MKNLKVIFMGTPEFSLPVLEALVENCNVIKVITKADALIGRKKELSLSPVKRFALEHNIPVETPGSLKDVSVSGADIIITCAYGKIVPARILNEPKYGCINVHASLLPRWRGASPMQYAIMHGDKKTGITIMFMDEGLDSGDIISQDEIDINEKDNLEVIHDKLSVLGRDLLMKTLPDIIKCPNKRIKQNEDEITYAPTIKREDELLDFKQKSIDIYNKVRALNPYPLSYVLLNGEETKIVECEVLEDNSNLSPGSIVDINKKMLTIKTLDGKISILKIKPFGKKVMPIKDYLNGLKDQNIKIN